MPEPMLLEDLDVVAYVGSRDPGLKPAIVAPVFRHRTAPTRFFVPPFELCGRWLKGATEISAEEYAAFIKNGRITSLPQTSPARPEHDLWLRLDGSVVYAPREQIEAERRKIVERHIELARKALIAGRREEVVRHCAIVSAADGRRVEPFAMRAALYRAAGDAEGERLMAQFAEDVISDVGFQALVAYYASLGAAPSGHKGHDRRNTVRGFTAPGKAVLREQVVMERPNPVRPMVKAHKKAASVNAPQGLAGTSRKQRLKVPALTQP